MSQSLSFGNALLVMVIGMIIVFFGLVVLIFLIKLLVKVTENMGKKKAAPAPVQVAPPSRPSPAPAEEEVQDDGALVAAIMAAISCVMAEEGSSFVVRRVRRVTNTPAWQRAGREEQIYSHL